MNANLTFSNDLYVSLSLCAMMTVFVDCRCMPRDGVSFAFQILFSSDYDDAVVNRMMWSLMLAHYGEDDNNRAK